MTDRQRPSPENTTASPGAADARRPAARRQRVGGIVQAVAGVFLLLLMGTVTWRMTPMLLAAPETLADGSHFNASQGTARLVLALFGSVLLFGGVALWSGVRQATRAGPAAPLRYPLWAAGALILILVALVVFSIKQGQA